MAIRLSFICMAFVCLVLCGNASAATLRVCSSGCQFSGLQPAIDAAAPGDSILLAAGQTFVGPFILRAKPGASWITIRSDAPDSSLPADGVRLVPSDKPGGNTSRSLLPRLIGQSGAWKTTPVLSTEPGAHHYVLKFLEIDGSANLGFETLIALGENSTAAVSYDIVVDRVYAHGHPWKGQKRGIALNSVRTDILNSYISDIKSVNADSQAICGFNGAGPFKIINNYLEGAGENILFGGADPAIYNLVPADIQILRNHIYKPLAWMNPILAAPASPGAAAGGGGVLAAGTHYFKIVALMDTDNNTAVSLPSASVAVTTGSSGTAALTWSAVGGADRYRIYRGTSASSFGGYTETSSPATSFTYTGSGERSGSPPTQGTFWTIKNLFELKNAERVRLEGNLIENSWAAGQFGYALVLTPRQGGAAPWVRVRDVVVVNNVIRHASGVAHIAGYDYPYVSQQTLRITLQNNLLDDIDGTKWGGYAKVFLVGDGVASVTIDRNTIAHKNSSVVYAYGSQAIQNFVYTNNIAEHGEYGIMGENGQSGQYSINMYFPGSTIAYNVLAGGAASRYPAANAFPTMQEWFASFVNFAAADYRLLTTSPFYGAGAGGSVPGGNLGAIDGALGFPVALPSAAPAPPSAVRVIR
ncbi:MAG: hypothetical protein WBC51_18230 [Vicinamibacterales bacterium]